MDKHLNLFYSYNQGSIDTLSKTIQLEDNLTRAFITVLISLEIEKQKMFLEMLVNHKIESENINYDLQNTDKYEPSKGTKKIVVIIQREKGNICLDGLRKIPKEVFSVLDENKQTQIEKLNIAYENGEDFELNSKTYLHSELNSLLQLLKGNRPDAWIIGEKETILFESKIGNNQASLPQIYRHITGKDGLQLKTIDGQNLEVINITWDEICRMLLEIASENYIIKQFNEYIKMNGQKLDFSYIVQNNFDSELHKAQLNIFLSKFDEAIQNKGLNLKRKSRGKFGLWEAYGVPDKKQTIQKDPHYSIHFGEQSIEIYITTKTLGQINSELIDEIQNYYNVRLKPNEIINQRYFLSANQYKLVDYRRGQIKGEFFSPFAFNLRFSEIHDKFPKIKDIIISITRLNIYKQFEFGLKIDFLNFEKIREDDPEKQLRKMNLDLLSNPDLIVKEFIQFVEESYDIFNFMRSKRKD